MVVTAKNLAAKLESRPKPVLPTQQKIKQYMSIDAMALPGDPKKVSGVEGQIMFDPKDSLMYVFTAGSWKKIEMSVTI